MLIIFRVFLLQSILGALAAAFLSWGWFPLVCVPFALALLCFDRFYALTIQSRFPTRCDRDNYREPKLQPRSFRRHRTGRSRAYARVKRHGKFIVPATRTKARC